MHSEKLDFELQKLKLEKVQENPVPSHVKSEFDAARNIRLVPKFQEKSVDKYFPQFEKIAANLKWPREFWPTLLQSVLIGKAAEVYSALSLAESSDYDKVKDAILKAYQLVPKHTDKGLESTKSLKIRHMLNLHEKKKICLINGFDQRKFQIHMTICVNSFL